MSPLPPSWPWLIPQWALTLMIVGTITIAVLVGLALRYISDLIWNYQNTKKELTHALNENRKLLVIAQAYEKLKQDLASGSYRGEPKDR